jgi:capsular polysaccharide biosynthesis protein
MQETGESSRKPWLLLFGCVGVVLLLSIFASSMMRSRQYMSVARLEVSGVANVTSGQTKSATAYDPYFIQTELERINSDATLTQVISDLRGVAGFLEHTGLKQDAPPSDAIRRLRKLIDLRQSRGTSFIDIRAYSSHPEISADLANKIAEVYIRTWKTNGVQVLLVDRAVPATRR